MSSSLDGRLRRDATAGGDLSRDRTAGGDLSRDRVGDVALKLQHVKR